MNVSKEFGRALIAEIVKCHRALDAADLLSAEIEDPTERDRIRRCLAEASGLLYSDIVMEIIRKHPDLDPYPKPSAKE